MKGMTGMEGVLIYVTLAGVVIISLFFGYERFFGGASQEFSQKECQSSLISSAGLKERTQDTLSCISPVKSLPLKCDRRFRTVSDTEVWDGDKKYTKSYDATCPTGMTKTGETCLPENVLATEMAECWQTFFSGELTVFNQVERNSFIQAFQTKDALRACFVCSEVTVDASKKIELVSYLQKEQYNKTTTYFDFLAARGICDPDLKKLDTPTHTCWDGIALGKETGFDKEWPRIEYNNMIGKNKYAVIFIRRGLGSCDNAETFFGISLSSISDDYLTNTVQVVPADRIADYCSVVLV